MPVPQTSAGARVPALAKPEVRSPVSPVVETSLKSGMVRAWDFASRNGRLSTIVFCKAVLVRSCIPIP